MNISPHLFLLFLLSLIVSANSQADLDQPWKVPSNAIVIDPYEGNSIEWDKLAADNRVVAIIHRATVGARKDKKYLERKAEGVKRGYKWGSYHLGLPGDPIKQADDYLAFVNPGEDEVVALDIESLDPAKAMSLADAVRFINRIKEKVGLYPLLYCNHAVATEISTKYGKDATFSNTPLWYARFKSNVRDFPKGTWTTYTIWQFSSEINCAPANETSCLYRVPGTKRTWTSTSSTAPLRN
jgi:lysozyme